MRLSDFEVMKTKIVASLAKKIESEEGYRGEVGLGLGNTYALKELTNSELVH